ncbi:MAG: DUF255 domain-containing protein, partial [Edaphocola sp.]
MPKKIFALLCLLGLVCQSVLATDTKKEINWLTFEEAEALMKKEPRKVIVDVYTSWCGWCKVMDKKTYGNDSVIDYINKYYYAVKFDAEQKTPVMFKGKKWEYSAQYKANTLALDLLQGRLSYPTTVFLNEKLENSGPVPG